MVVKITGFKHICNFSIDFGKDCALVGIMPTGNIMVEAYTDDDVKTYCISTQCEVLDANPSADLIMPTVPNDHPLNQRGGRLRGLREADRVASWAQPLTIMEKMPLMPKLGLSIAPMMLLGIAESHVLSEAMLTDTVSFVCRRLRFAYALAETKVDDDGLPYDYDTLETFAAHLYDTEDETLQPIHEAFAAIDDITLQRPMDCIVQDNKLIIADSSKDDKSNRILIFEIMTTPE